VKAAVLYGKYNIVVEEVDKPHIEEDEQVLVRVHSALLCGADLHLFVGNMKSQYPIVPGYCFSGVIEEVGAGVTDFREKDRVCGLNFGSFGAFAQNILLSQKRIYKIPDSVQFEEAAFIEQVTLAFKSLELTKPVRGENVLVIGQGILGLIHTQLFKKAGTIVFSADLIPSRLSMSRKTGADYLLNPEECDVLETVSNITERGIDIVIEATGSPKTVELLSKLAREGVRMVLFGVGWWNPAMREQVEIYRVYGTRDIRKEDCLSALKTISEGEIDLRTLISHRIPLEKIEEAYRLALNPSQGEYTPKAIGVIINP